MEKKNIDWSSLGFGYVKTDKRFVSNYKDGAWDAGVLTDDATITMSECACAGAERQELPEKTVLDVVGHRRVGCHHGAVGNGIHAHGRGYEGDVVHN